MPRWFVPSLSFSTRSVPYFFALEKKSLRPIESTLRKTTLDRSGAAISGIRGWFSFNIACVMKLLLYCKSFVKFQSVYFSKGNFDRSMEFLRNLFHNEANEARSHQNQCSNKTCIRSGHFSSLRHVQPAMPASTCCYLHRDPDLGQRYGLAWQTRSFPSIPGSRPNRQTGRSI